MERFLELISVLSGVGGDLYVRSGLPISIVKVVEQDGQNGWSYCNAEFLCQAKPQGKGRPEHSKRLAAGSATIRQKRHELMKAYDQNTGHGGMG